MEARALLTATITDLGTLGHRISEATSINEAGRIAGYFGVENVGEGAFIYSNGVITDLGSLPGAEHERNPVAYGINDQGQIVGLSGLVLQTIPPDPEDPESEETYITATRAFLYQGGSMIDLGTLGVSTVDDPLDSEAYSINDAGQIVGVSEIYEEDPEFDFVTRRHAFLYSGGSMIDIGPSLYFSEARAINDSGQVVGSAAFDPPDSEGDAIEHAFLYAGGSMIDLGTLGGVSSRARAINDSGLVVGAADTSGGPSHAFSYIDGVMTDLGTLGGRFSIAYGVNDRGQVVGYSTTEDGAAPFLYSGGVMINLQDQLPADSGWELDVALDINDRGQVVGSGLHNGVFRAFLMTLDEQSPDITTTALDWDATRGGVNLSYSIGGAPLPMPTTTTFYWSADGKFDPGIDVAVPGSSNVTGTAVGDYEPIHVAGAAFGTPPQGTNYLLAVADPTDIIIESDESNNVKALLLSDLSPTRLSWNVAGGGVDYAYTVAGVLPVISDAGFFWSTDTTYDPAKDLAITGVSIALGASGSISGQLGASSFTISPPDGTKYLLFVTDPGDRFRPELSEANNVAFAAYEPEIVFVQAKYDGDPDSDLIGRFFANPDSGKPLITDQSLTLRLSESLAALRPTLKVGGFGTSPQGGGDGRTYISEGFDPGTLDDMTFLVAQANLRDKLLAEADSPKFRVLPLPDWYDALLGSEATKERQVSFDARGGGSYSFKGFVARLGSLDQFSPPADVPIIGGLPLGASLGFGWTATAPLDVRQSPTRGAFVGFKANILNLASVDRELSSTVKLPDGYSLQLTTQRTLDPVTLEMDGGFGLTIKVSASETFAEKTFLDKTTIVPGIFAILDMGIKGAITLVLNAQAQVSLVSGRLQLVGGGGTYIDYGPTGTLTGFANVGWFIPPKFTDPITSVLRRRLPKYFPAAGNLLPALRLKNELVGSLDLRGRVDYTGDVSSPSAAIDASLESTVNLQVKATLEFTIGNTNLLGVVDPFVVQLFPTKLPKKFRLG